MTKRQAKAEAKLQSWGEVPEQQELFDETATLTPEIREWRQKQHGDQEV